MSFQIEYLKRLEGDLRTAAARQRPRRAWRRTLAPRTLIVAAAVVLMGGSLALAFGGRVITALGDGPAPSKVKSTLDRMTSPPYPLDGAPPLPKDYLPGKIVPGSQHRVLTYRTSRGKVAALYVARTTRGGACFVTVGGPFGSGGCLGTTPVKGAFSDLTVGQTMRSRNGKRFGGPVLTIVARAASPRAASVRIVYGDATHHDVALVDGWFMFEVPAAHAMPSTAPVRVDVLSTDGTRVGSLAEPFAFYLHPPKPHFTSPLPASIKLLASAELPNNGGTVKIWSGRDAQGRNCFRYLRNGRSQRGPVWDCTAMVGHYGYPLHPANRKQSQAHAAVQWQMGLANDWRRPVDFGYAYAIGWVAPGVTRLTLRFQDGSSTDIPLHDQYYVYVVSRANWPAGHRPSILEARNAQGRAICREFLYPRQHCIYPGHDPLCRNLAMGTG
jgi:hypothetical protein